jgi:hypothetical protein
MERSDENWKPLRVVIVVGLLLAAVLAFIPGYQRLSLEVLMVTPLAMSAVTGVLLLRRGMLVPALSYLLACAMVLVIVFLDANGK